MVKSQSIQSKGCDLANGTLFLFCLEVGFKKLYYRRMDMTKGRICWLLEGLPLTDALGRAASGARWRVPLSYDEMEWSKSAPRWSCIGVCKGRTRSSEKVVIGTSKRTKRSMARGMRSRLSCSTASYTHDGEVKVIHN